MKRYLFIDGQLNSGGAERVLLDIFRNFDYSNNEVTLLQVNAGGTLLDEVPSNVKIISAWNGYTTNFRLSYRFSQWFGCNYLLRDRLLKTIGDTRYDVAISFLEGMPLKMHAMITEVADRNYSWVHCDLDTDRYEVGQFRSGEEIAAYNKMTGVVCVAPDTAKAFIRRFPNCASSLKVIYNPIDIDKIKYLSVEGGDNSLEIEDFGCCRRNDKAILAGAMREGFVIVVCGRLTPPKKMDRVIRFAHRVKVENLPIRIQIIGDGSLKETLIRQALELDVMDMLDFIGFVRNPYPYIKKADMLLSTSGYEGFSLVVCEAMALGVPVVATKTAGPIGILEDNRYGLLCDHDDESIFQTVNRLFKDSDLRMHYASLGPERVKDFSVERTMKEIYQL